MSEPFSFSSSLISSDGKQLSLAAYLLLAFLCLVFFLPGIAALPPTDRDESSFAQASKQMIETGNYVDIRLQKEPRYKKPIGIYWLQSSAVRVLNPDGLNEIWAYRVPSLLGAVIAVLMTAAIGAVLFSPVVGFIAAVMLASCVLLNVEARLAKTDAALLGCTVAVMYALARAWKWRRESISLRMTGELFNSALFWTALAFGVLIKGPMILLPIIGVILWLRVGEGSVSWLKGLHPYVGVILAAALVAPWFVAISMQSHGAFMQQSAGHDMFAKIFQGQNRGIVPPGVHAMLFPALFFPFSLLALLSVAEIWKNRRDPAVRFCLGWIIPTWLVFELSFTKLPHYVLPAYPAIALLTAKFFVEGFPAVLARLRRFYVLAIYVVWFAIGSGAAVLFSVLPIVSDGEVHMGQVAAGAFLVAAQVFAAALLRKRELAGFVAMVLGSLVFLSVAIGCSIPSLRHVWLSREIVSAIGKIAACSPVQIVSFGYKEPSLAFLAGTNTVMARSGAEAALALQKEACVIAVINGKNKPEFMAAFDGASVRPIESGFVSGLNSGHGASAEMTLYRLSGM